MHITYVKNKVNKSLEFRSACKYPTYVNIPFVRNTYTAIDMALHGFNHYRYHNHLKIINRQLCSLQTNKQTNKQTFHIYIL